MTKQHVMVDLETLGTDPGAVILSIGAVRFDTDGIDDETLHVSVDPESCQDYGLSIDADTLTWWLEQDDAVTDILRGGIPLDDALHEFTAFIDDADTIWANSPTFDCSILRAAYDAIGDDVPWSYRDERDFRTLSHLPVAPDIPFDGDKHNALDDATHQAQVTIETLTRLTDTDDTDTTDTHTLLDHLR